MNFDKTTKLKDIPVKSLDRIFRVDNGWIIQENKFYLQIGIIKTSVYWLNESVETITTIGESQYKSQYTIVFDKNYELYKLIDWINELYHILKNE